MAVATERFAAKGYHPTSVAEVVRQVGVGKGVFYWYFDSKEALFEAILRDGQLDLRRAQRAAIGDAGRPLERLARGVAASMQWTAANPDLFRLMQFAITERRFARVMREGRDVAASDAMVHVKAAIAEGEIPDADPHVLTVALLGVVTELNRTFVRPGKEPSSGVIDAAVNFCLGGLLGAKRC